MQERKPEHRKEYWPSELCRPFRAVIFDWDGTAVPDRQSSVQSLVDAMERNLLEHVLLVIITGTKIEHLQNQALQFLTPSAKRSLYVCTNRGSEVFGFDKNGAQVIKFKRVATVDENQALDAAARKVQHHLSASYGIKAEIVENRLNRRKIDLIPEWPDPKKSEFPRLLKVMEEKLRQNRVFGGLQALVRHAESMAKESGVSDPRVTSDIKHIEIGLTDKSDSVSWIRSNLLDGFEIPLEDVIFSGDEFGPVGNLAGSDSWMRTTATQGATFFSVGAEPHGPGQGIHDLKGGPSRFVEFLDLQFEIRREHNASLPPLWRRHPPTADEVWCVEQEGFDPSRERAMETIFTIGNGYLGVRGALDSPIPSSQADLYIAGIYDQKVPDLPYSELEFLTLGRKPYPYSELVSLPSPFRMRMSLDGQPLSLIDATWRKHDRVLDLRKGIYVEKYDYEDQWGNRVSVESLRCASTVDKHLLLHDIMVSTESVRGVLEIDFSLVESKLSLHHPHLRQMRHESDNAGTESIKYRTRASKFEIGIASTFKQSKGQASGHKLIASLEPNSKIRFRRFISVFTSRDTSQAYLRARQRLSDLDWSEFDEHIDEHESRWSDLWQQSDIDFSGSVAATEAMRFNSYHLHIAAPTASYSSIGARTLSGRGYEGHIFWDTEIFMLPFYVHSVPEKAKMLLLYRYRTLDGARKRAREMGHPGACYAWESTVTGEDVTPDRILLKTSKKEIPIFTGEQQIHVTADVAFGIWRYWHSTRDDEFMRDFGVEILIETARFWSSRCKQRGSLFHILNVVGPDEYHHGVNDNAFTNWMVKHNLATSLYFVEWIKNKYRKEWAKLTSELRFKDKEVSDWRNVHDRLFIPVPNDAGIIEQFEGFFDLDDYDLRSDERLRAPIDRLFDWKEINRLRLIKQADVLMLPFLFREKFSLRELDANFRYYEPITDHGSSLSPSVHATIAAWIGDHDAAHRYFRQSLELDLFNIMQNTALGIHAACMGGTWQALVFGILGVRVEDEKLVIDDSAGSRLSRDWRSVSLNLKHRSKNFPVTVRRNGVQR